MKALQDSTEQKKRLKTRQTSAYLDTTRAECNSTQATPRGFNVIDTENNHPNAPTNILKDKPFTQDRLSPRSFHAGQLHVS